VLSTAAIILQSGAGLNVKYAERSIRRGERGLALFGGKAAEARERRRHHQVEWIKRAARQVHWGEGGGQHVARVVEHGFEIAGGEAVGQGAENFGRLVEPEAGDDFGGLLRVLHPGWLPGDGGDEVGFLAQTRRDDPGQFFHLVAVGRAQGDEEFAAIGEILLIQLQPPHRRLAGGKQVQNLRVEAQPGKARRHEQEQDHPPRVTPPGFHGSRKPSTVSLLRVLSSRQLPSERRSKRQGGATCLFDRPLQTCNQARRAVGSPPPA
jgi:hypothetical protein